MKTAEFNDFFKEKMKKIFSEKQYIIDIGGGLRLVRSNIYEHNNEWILPLLSKVRYEIMDKVPDYDPDIVGDIHAIPLDDNSVDAIICMSVLEHVEEPQLAVREMYRVLKPGGYCFIYVPFLYYYHPMEGYYKDFYRFTYDGLEYMTKDFSSVQMERVLGPLTTVLNLFPFLSKRVSFLNSLDRWLRPKSRQVSGYNVFCIK